VVTIDEIGTGLLLSDPVILRPIGRSPPPATRTDASFVPIADLRFEPFDTIGIYAEIRGLPGPTALFEVQVSVEKASRSSLPARIANWLGDRLGMSSPSGPPRLRWSATADATGTARVAVDLALDGLDTGAHVIVLQVRDPVSGQTAESRRILVVES
jgi:hypothetical protein